MRLIEVSEKELLALKAVVYGCNTNKRLVGASYLTGIGTENEKTISFYEALKIVDEMFDEKTIDAAPVVHGRWEETVEDWVMCSVCWDEWNKRIVPVEDFNYCPNCGARMDAEVDAE